MGTVILAIDGPAGAGKSSVAKAVAKALGWRFVDTGAMYRAVALAVLESGVDAEDHAALEKIAADVDITLGSDRVLLNGRDVTERIRDPDVTELVSRISAVGGVRAAMVTRQRAADSRGGIVLEGRDIGTRVFPDAEVKVFLTASLDARADRRRRQLRLPDNPATLAALRESLERRDAADSTRAESPLARAPDAVSLDTTAMTLGEVVGEIVALVRRRADGG